MGQTAGDKSTDRGDESLAAENVLRVIREGQRHRRVIWSPTTLLDASGVRPLVGQQDYPATLRRRAKRMLEALCGQGHLVRRREAHSIGGRFEVAYMLPAPDDPRVAVVAKAGVYDPRAGGRLLGGARPATFMTEGRMYRLLDPPRPSADLGRWRAVVGPFTQVVGWTCFGDFFLRNPHDGYFALLLVKRPRFVALIYHDPESFEHDFVRPGRSLLGRQAVVLALEERLGKLDPKEVFAPASSLDWDCEPERYVKQDVWAFAARAAARHRIGEHAAVDLLLRHLRRDDEFDLWRAVVETILAELAVVRPTSKSLVQIGRCSHWLRPHQTRWTADGGFAWPSGYGSGTGGYCRDALPQFDWSVVLVGTGADWAEATDRSARPAVRVAIPSRTRWHAQAAVHTVWMTGREKERRFYGFRKKGGAWSCTAESEWAEDRLPSR